MSKKVYAIIAAVSLALAIFAPVNAALTIPGTVTVSNPASGNATLWFNKVTTASATSGSVPIVSMRSVAFTT